MLLLLALKGLGTRLRKPEHLSSLAQVRCVRLIYVVNEGGDDFGDMGHHSE
jgi:hypothetical protein